MNSALVACRRAVKPTISVATAQCERETFFYFREIFVSLSREHGFTQPNHGFLGGKRRGQRVILARKLLATLRGREVSVAAEGVAAETGLEHRLIKEGQRASGIYRRNIMLASGRYAMLDDGKHFSLVPWKPVIERRLGQQMSAVMQPQAPVRPFHGSQLRGVQESLRQLRNPVSKFCKKYITEVRVRFFLRWATRPLPRTTGEEARTLRPRNVKVCPTAALPPFSARPHPPKALLHLQRPLRALLHTQSRERNGNPKPARRLAAPVPGFCCCCCCC